MAIVFTVWGVLFIFLIMAIILIIAGKDIIMALKRFVVKQGSDVFILNSTRNMDHFYKVPKDHKFYIKDTLYVTNPEKVLNLCEVDKLKVIESIKKTRQNIKSRINTLDHKIEIAKNTVRNITDEAQKNIYYAEIERLKQIKLSFESKLDDRVKNYFNRRRSAFFYIEGDPVPKDMFEFYSELDSKIFDNLLKGALSEPPQLPNMFDDKSFKIFKIILFATALLSVVGVIVGFLSVSWVREICTAVGGNCNF